jgi:hypothetical protein
MDVSPDLRELVAALTHAERHARGVVEAAVGSPLAHAAAVADLRKIERLRGRAEARVEAIEACG